MNTNEKAEYVLNLRLQAYRITPEFLSGVRDERLIAVLDAWAEARGIHMSQPNGWCYPSCKEETIIRNLFYSDNSQRWQCSVCGRDLQLVQ